MQKRGVTQYSKAMVSMGHFESIREAQASYGITHISSVCQRKRRTDGGYIWRYDDDRHPDEFSKEVWERLCPPKERKRRHSKRKADGQNMPKKKGRPRKKMLLPAAGEASGENRSRI